MEQGSSPNKFGIDTDIEDNFQSIAPSMAQSQLPVSMAGSANTPIGLEDHSGPISSPQAPYQGDFSTSGSSEMSTAKDNNFEPLIDPTVPQHSMLRGGRVSTSPSALRRDTRAFAPSPLVHSQPAPSSSIDGHKEAERQALEAPASPIDMDRNGYTEERGDASSADHQLLRETQVDSSSVAKSTHPSVSAYSEMALSFPKVKPNTTQRSSSPLKETTLSALERVDDDLETPGEPIFAPLRKVSTFSSATSRLGRDIETPGEPTFPPWHPLWKVSTLSTSPRQATPSPPERQQLAIESPRAPTFPAGTPLRKVPSLSSSPPNTSSKSGTGPPVSLYEQAFLRLVDTVADKDKNNTNPPPPPRFSFSPTSNTNQVVAPSPRPVKLAKKKMAREVEDPFEGFNSGSEKDAESDADFDEGEVSSEVSVEEEEGEGEVSGEDEGGARAEGKGWGVARQARKRKEREEDSEDGSRNENTPRPRKVMTDYPTASEAFKGVKDGEGATPERSGSLNVSHGFEGEKGTAVGFLGDGGGGGGGSGGDRWKAEGFGDEERRNGKDWTLVVSEVGGKRVTEWKIMKWRGWGKSD